MNNGIARYSEETFESINKFLAEAAQKAGVIKSYEFAIFQNYGYQGLYGRSEERR